MKPSKKDRKQTFPGKGSFPKSFPTATNKTTHHAEIGDELFYSNEDPFGMYTGIPTNKNETPVQDADDL